MKVGAVIQARMTSSRLPGKVLREVAGEPMLEYLLERARRCGSLDGLVVATSREESDSPIAEFCERRGVPVHRGPLTDVAARFREVLARFPWAGFVRLTGDSPLLDTALVEHAVRLFREREVDLVTNTLVRTYPKGQSVEVVRSETFRRAYEMMREADDFEHVTRIFHIRPGLFRICSFVSPDDNSRIDLSVDTPEQMATFSAIVTRMKRPHWQYGLEEILRIHRALREQSERGDTACGDCGLG
jgi:spore coat polysaccharide biosynthesis protein SpsF